MSEGRRRLALDSIRLADVIVMALAFGVAVVASGQYHQPGSLDEFLSVRVKLTNFMFLGLFVFVWSVVFKSFGLYKAHRERLTVMEWWDITKAVGVGTLLLSGAGMIVDFSAITKIFVASFFLCALIGTIVARTLLRSVIGTSGRNGRSLKNLVIVGCGPRGAKFGKEVRSKPELGYLLLGYLDEIEPPDNPLHGEPEKLLGSPAHAREILNSLDVDEVVINLPIKSFYETIDDVIKACEEIGLDVRVPADFFESRLVHAYAQGERATPVLTLGTKSPAAGSAVLKRAIDLGVSGLVLVLASPLLILIAALIVIDSWGSPLFVQDRIGYRRKRFPMVKFRTMHLDAEARLQGLEKENEVSGAAFKMRNDPRVTRVGKILRKFSLDELPQFLNVLRGDMSLVGPRPLPIRDVERFNDEWQKRRFSVKPGLTCLWQVNGRHDIDFEHWMELDLQYIDNWSLSLDFDILVKTLPAVLRGSGAS